MNDLQNELTHMRSTLGGVRNRLTYEREQIARITARIEALATEKELLVRALGLIDRTIQVVSANGIGKIEQTVTNGLRLVFTDQEPMALKVVKSDSKRGSTYALEIQQGDVQGPILDTFGGGVANVTSFLLRVIMIKRFKLAKFLVLDESFNNVSVKYLPMVSDLLKTLAHDGKYSILAVSHQPVLSAEADNVYRAVENPDGPPILQKLTSAQVAEIRREAGV